MDSFTDLLSFDEGLDLIQELFRRVSLGRGRHGGLSRLLVRYNEWMMVSEGDVLLMIGQVADERLRM